MKDNNRKAGDVVVHTVLEEIFKASEIDPSTIWPDNHFHDLGLNQQMILNVFHKSAQSLGLQVNFEENKVSTPRQMVDLLRQMGASRAS
jgi:hypothetical protein